MISEFSEKLNRKIAEIVGKYPETRAALLPVLRAVQEEYGWISDRSVSDVASILNLKETDVHSTMSFYTMFNRKPVGKYHIQICRNISCRMAGSADIGEKLEKVLKIKPGETTPDKKFTLSYVECLGSCGTAPVMMVNEDYHENLDPEKAAKIIESLKKR